MQELVDQLTQKAGLTEEQAMKAIQVLTEHIQSKLPPMMQGMVANFIGGESADKGDDIGMP